MRSIWDGPIVLKGIQTVDDARIAVDTGSSAIASRTTAAANSTTRRRTLDLVPPVVDAVGERVEIYCDGGVRRGSDILKAIALGATACLIGRAYLYALAAAGEAGVDRVLALFDADVRRTMALLGVDRVGELSPEFVERRPGRRA